MKLSTRSRYGTRLLLDLALHDQAGPQPLRQISRRTAISVKYLEQIIPRLLGAGLVVSSRGQNGGYTLAGSAGSIRLSEVVKALEGSLDPVACTETGEICPLSPDCASREIWREMSAAIHKTLDRVSLADLAARHRDKQADRNAAMYYI